MTPQEMLDNLLEKTLIEIQPVSAIRQSLESLAHYTSIEVLEKILSTDEIWFSAPQFMNDLHELSYGMEQGAKTFFQYSDFSRKATDDAEFATKIKNQFARFMYEYHTSHNSSIYVLCFSDHTAGPPDGQLSMWRAYGGKGKGAALVFNTSILRERTDSVLLIAKVKYEPLHERINSIAKMIQRWAVAVRVINPAPTDENAAAAAQALFVSNKLLALITKHVGFEEEKEWRLIYIENHDRKLILRSRIGNFIGPRGLEPKLKMPIKPLPLDPPENWTFDSALDKIILGPGMSEKLHRRAFEEMLKRFGKHSFKSKIQFSTIPLRVDP